MQQMNKYDDDGLKVGGGEYRLARANVEAQLTAEQRRQCAAFRNWHRPTRSKGQRAVKPRWAKQRYADAMTADPQLKRVIGMILISRDGLWKLQVRDNSLFLPTAVELALDVVASIKSGHKIEPAVDALYAEVGRLFRR
jgi:hypothetical protein